MDSTDFDEDGIHDSKDVEEFATTDGSRLFVKCHVCPPDTPTELSVSDVTDTSVRLTWNPGFDGGMKTYFRLKYVPILDRDEVRHFDVYPGDTNSTDLNLKPGTSYKISIMAFNNLGESPYSEAIIATTMNTTTSKYRTREI